MKASKSHGIYTYGNSFTSPENQTKRVFYESTLYIDAYEDLESSISSVATNDPQNKYVDTLSINTKFSGHLVEILQKYPSIRNISFSGSLRMNVSSKISDFFTDYRVIDGRVRTLYRFDFNNSSQYLYHSNDLYHSVWRGIVQNQEQRDLIRHVDLCECNLVELPPALLEIPNIESIELANNDLLMMSDVLEELACRHVITNGRVTWHITFTDVSTHINDAIKRIRGHHLAEQIKRKHKSHLF